MDVTPNVSVLSFRSSFQLGFFPPPGQHQTWHKHNFSSQFSSFQTWFLQQKQHMTWTLIFASHYWPLGPFCGITTDVIKEGLGLVIVRHGSLLYYLSFFIIRKLLYGYHRLVPCHHDLHQRKVTLPILHAYYILQDIFVIFLSRQSVTSPGLLIVSFCFTPSQSDPCQTEHWPSQSQSHCQTWVEILCVAVCWEVACFHRLWMQDAPLLKPL